MIQTRHLYARERIYLHGTHTRSGIYITHTYREQTQVILLSRNYKTKYVTEECDYNRMDYKCVMNEKQSTTTGGKYLPDMVHYAITTKQKYENAENAVIGARCVQP